MRRIYRKIRQQTIETVIGWERCIVPLVGFSTFFFGFGAGAVLNLYLLAINHPLVSEFRSVLSYRSAIFGDGIILPVIAMVSTSFLLENRRYIVRRVVQGALLAGGIITAWFHVSQAINGVVNWAMPSPWHWNFLGLWHAVYMFSVASFFSLFYLVVLTKLVREKKPSRETLIVTLGFIVFFILLRLDYI